MRTAPRQPGERTKAELRKFWEKLCDSRFKMEKGAPIDDPVAHEHCLKELNGLHRVIEITPAPHIAFERSARFLF